MNLTPTTCVENEAGISDSPKKINGYGGFSSLNRCYHSGNGSLKFTVGRRELSSEAGASSTKDEDGDDLEEGFSELETPAGEESEKLLGSDTELSDKSDESDIEEPRDELELPLSPDEDVTEKKLSRRKAESELFKAIMEAPGLTIHKALDKWVEEGKEISREEISLAMVNLRKRNMFGRALQVIESV